MATFSLPGDLGTFVRSNPFDTRRKQYMQSGLNNVLGDFVGSVQQNQALYNKINQAPKPQVGPPAPDVYASGQAAQQANSVGPTPAPMTPKTLNPASGVGNVVPGIPQTPKVPAPAVAPAAPAQPLYEQYAGSPDVFDIKSGKALTYEEAQAKGDVFGNAQKGYGGGGLSNLVRLNQTARPEVQAEGDFKKYDQVDLGGQAKQIEEASGGVAGAEDIMAAVDQNPDVVLAREEANRKKAQGASALDRALGRLQSSEKYKEQDLGTKALDLKNKLLSNLEGRGLALGGIRDTGEAAIAQSTDQSVARLKDQLSTDQMDTMAKKLATDENIDIALAKTITRAATTEYKAREAAKQKEQAAVDSFLGKMGLVRNPVTGEVTKTVAEQRAEDSAQRAKESSARAAAAAAKKKATTVTTTTTGGTPITKLLSASQITGLNKAGLDAGLYTSITEDILGGVSLDQIRQDLTKHGKDPKILDSYDKIVGISGLLAKQPNKTPKGSGREI